MDLKKLECCIEDLDNYELLELNHRLFDFGLSDEYIFENDYYNLDYELGNLSPSEIISVADNSDLSGDYCIFNVDEIITFDCDELLCFDIDCGERLLKYMVDKNINSFDDLRNEWDF